MQSSECPDSLLDSTCMPLGYTQARATGSFRTMLSRRPLLSATHKETPAAQANADFQPRISIRRLQTSHEARLPKWITAGVACNSGTTSPTATMHFLKPTSQGTRLQAASLWRQSVRARSQTEAGTRAHSAQSPGFSICLAD